MIKVKYLITGGAGFIGNHFIKYMIDKYPNDFFVCLDLLTYAASPKALDEVSDNKNFKFIKGDICDKDLVDKLFKDEQFDYVVNFAAESHVDRSFIYPKLFYKTNVIGTKVLLEASKKYNIKRFHQVSTDEVYGELGLEESSFTETSPLNPTTPYSKSKAMADLLVIEYINRYNLYATISRSTNNYGTHQHSEKLIPKVVNMALNKEKITIYGDGSNIRDWVYVMDHCSAIDLILHNGKSGEIYNVGANKELSNLTMINNILKVLDVKKYEFSFIVGRVHDDNRYSLDCSKIKEQLNWNASSDFDETFCKTVLWYKENIYGEKICKN